MLNQLNAFVNKEGLFAKNDKLLVAVSGGVDSVVMCHLLSKSGISFAIAHCNFGLRGKESEEDESFVETVAEKYCARFHSASFDTKHFAATNKLSIQLAARNLRYEWFEKIRKEFKYSLIVTAHHRDDSIESFLINLIRGTGISGLHGILPKQNKIIRPLLFASKAEILNYAKKNKLSFREDSSNLSDKYLRNKIRHHLIPALKELNPRINESLTSTIENIRNAETIYHLEIDKKRKKYFQTKGETIKIPISKLLKLKSLSAYLFEFLYPFGFNSSMIADIESSLVKQSGKSFFSETHRIIKDREYLIIDKISPSNSDVFSIKKKQKSIQINDLTLKFSTLPSGTIFSRSKNIACLDLDRLKFPLSVRKWQHGDVFQPLGMKGKKKLSDFFTDNKFSLAEKENTWLLISDKEIAWVIGHRIDDRFKVTDKTKTIYLAELSE